MYVFLSISALAFTVTLALSADVVTEHRTEDKVFLGRQLVERACDEQTDGIQALLPAKIDIDILFASRLHHVVYLLMAQTVGGKLLQPAIAGEEYHPTNTFLIFVNMVHQYFCLRGKRVGYCCLLHTP